MNTVPSIAAFLGLAILLTGGWLIWSAFIRRGDRPHCRTCNYDVGSQLDNRRTICPECGQDLTIAQSTAIGARVFRRGRLLTGVILLLGLAGVGIWRATSGLTWYDILPNGYLIYLTREAPLDEALAAYRELEQRWGPDSLSDHDFVEAGLNLHGRLPVEHHGWSDMRMFGRALVAHDTTKQQWQRLADQVVSAVAFRTRPAVQVGHPIPFQLEMNRGSPHPIVSNAKIVELRIDGIPVVKELLLGGGSTASGDGTITLSGHFPAIDAPGNHELVIQAEVKLNGMPEESLAVSHKVEQTITVMVSAHETVHLREADQTLPELRIRHSGNYTNSFFPLRFEARALSVPVAFEVYIDWGTGLQPARWQFGPTNKPAQIHWDPNVSRGKLSANLRLPQGQTVDEATRVDILLAPSVEAANQTTTLTEICNAGLLYKQVSVQQPSTDVIPRILTPEEVAALLPPEDSQD